MAGLSLKQVGKVYPGGITAVEEFNLEIRDREFIILVGPSGCGKSTVLRMIAGLENITSGEVHIGTRKVNRVAPKNRDIAMVFQNYALYPHMDVYQNMAFGLKMRRTPRKEIRTRVEETARQLEISDLLHRKPGALSGGQRQRVALGRAMVRNPAVFLLDEPLSNLDAKLRSVMRAEISQLHKKLAGTFVYVTHDQTEAMTMGDRIVVMKDGRIQQVDTPANLYNHPCNLFVAGFIGSPQMNLFPVGLSCRDGVWAAALGASQIVLEPCKSEALAPHRDRELLLGVRPEHIAVLPKKESGSVEAVVVLVEFLGAEMLLHLDIAGHRAIAKIPPQPLAVGDEVHLHINRREAHLFDPVTELLVCNFHSQPAGLSKSG